MPTYIYVGSRSGGPGSGTVAVREHGGTTSGVTLPPRNDVRNHSPDGLEWGYGGSGPGQLALALLLHALNEPLTPETRCGECQHLSQLHGARACDDFQYDAELSASYPCICRGFVPEYQARALRLYMRFKFSVVARIGRPTWSLTSDQVRSIVRDLEANDDAAVERFVAIWVSQGCSVT